MTGTGAATSDSDGDTVGDSVELGLGTNPLAADSDGDGSLDGATTGGLDSDGDTLDDGLEQVLHSDPFGTDSDADGFTDKAEYGAGYDLADPLSNPLVRTGGRRHRRHLGQISPCRTAYATACERLRRPNRRVMSWMTVFTVRSE